VQKDMRLSIFVPFASFVQASSEFYCLGDADKGATTVSLTSDESYCRLRPRDDVPHKVRLKMAGLSDTNACTEDEDRIFITSNGSLLGPLCPKTQEKHILDWFKEEVDKESIYDAIFDATETTMIFVPGNKGDSSAQQVMIKVAWENLDKRLSSDKTTKSSASKQYVPTCPISTFTESFFQAAKAKLAKVPKKIVRKMGIKFNELYDNFDDHSEFCQEDALAVDCSIFEENDGGTKLGIYTALRQIVKHITPECSTDYVKGFKEDLENLREILGYEEIDETTTLPSTIENFTTIDFSTTTTAVDVTTTTSSTSTTMTPTTTTSSTTSTLTTTTIYIQSTSTSTSTTTSPTTTKAPTSTTDYTTTQTSTTTHPPTALPLEITTELLKTPEEERFSPSHRGDSISSSGKSMCKIRNMPERFMTIFSARAHDIRKPDFRIVKKAVASVSKSFKYCDQGLVLCDLIQMNRKMHGCQFIKSLDKVVQFLSFEGSCSQDWLNDVAQKIENAQKVFDMDNCPANQETLPIAKRKDMNQKFFANEKITLQEALLEVADRKVPLSHRSWMPKIRLTMKSALAALENPEDALTIAESDVCSMPHNLLQSHCGIIFTRFIDSLRGDSSASEQTVEMTSGMMARVLRKFRLENRTSKEVKISCTDLRIQRNMRTSYLEIADSVYRMIRINNSR